MLTTAIAWVAAQGIVGGYEQPRRHHVGGDNDGAHGTHHQKLVIFRTVIPPPPSPKTATTMCNERVEPDLGIWVRYSRRKRKKQERVSPEVEEVDGSEKGEEETKAVAVCSPCRQVCVDCGTSRTPLWRKGPAGPKSLCNACGIRYRKIKKAGGGSPTTNLASTAAASGGDRPKGNTRPNPGVSGSSKPAAAAAEEVEEEGEKLRRRKKRRQEVVWRLLEESRKFEFPCGKEAVEAAVLLMAMSSGLFIPSS